MKSRKELSNIASVCSDDIVTIKCIFSQKNDKDSRYTFKTTKAIANSLSVNDFVNVVKSNGEFAIVKVVEIHDRCIFDEMVQWAHNWAFQKVDIEHYNILYEMEEKLIDMLDQSQRKTMQSKMIEALDLDDDTKKLLSGNNFTSTVKNAMIEAEFLEEK